MTRLHESPDPDAGSRTPHSKPTGSRATLRAMVAQRVACQTPWGEAHDLVVVEDRIVVPGELADLRSLSWLAAEHHPRLAVTALSVLERATGAALGLSPYCVAAERWNRAARGDQWLPVVALGREAGGTVSEAAGPAVARASLLLPERATRLGDAARAANRSRSALLDGLQNGRDAVGGVLDVVRLPLRAMVQLVAVAACVYYLLTAGAWLWVLRDGMDAAELQSGVLVVFVGFLLSTVTRAVWDRSPNDRPAASTVRRVQPIVDTTLGAYRLGISLQVLAFAAFAVF
jgi:hypothetical protein